jgi:hypothetical protein
MTSSILLYFRKWKISYRLLTNQILEENYQADKAYSDIKAIGRKAITIREKSKTYGF